jgi:hypothetical protein
MTNKKSYVSTETKTIQTVKWSEIPTGTTFKAKIKGKKTEGQIYNSKRDNFIYLCSNNNVINGTNPPKDLGYKFAWAISKNNTTSEMFGDYITDIEFGDIPKGFEAPFETLSVGGYEAEIFDGYVEIGGCKIDNKIIRKIGKNLIP